jgi:cytochrome c biogenesis protein CcmG, thiol:disulfide interchange protein DsbE
VLKQMPDPAGRSRRLAALAGAFLALALALAACGGGDDGGSAPPPPDYQTALAGAPPKLAALYKQGDALIDGGSDAFQQQLDRLRGYPVVVNNWASWCGPCRGEFPVFQRAAASQGERVAFVGVDSQDSDDAAKTFLDEYPVPYPSYTDPDQDIGKDFLNSPVGLPATGFYSAGGKLQFVHAGPYESEADLVADIKRYAE